MTRLLLLAAFFAFGALSHAQTPTASPPAADATSLFNGKDLAGWKPTGKPEGWVAENGVIVCKGGGGYLLTEKEYADFDLKFEFRWEKPGGNSGVALRTPEKGDPAYAGMEIQLIDDEGYEKAHNYKLKPAQHTGSVYDVQPAKPAPNKPIGEWNAVHVRCVGRKVTVTVNGTEINAANLDDYKDKAAKHPGLARDKGHIGFQTHDGRVEFRNVVLVEAK